jgi:tetratricopeptide (TPR) repeat protein
MEENANEEAVELLTNALKLYAQLDLHDSLRLEKCHVNLGEALYSLGRYDESIENFLWALDLTGNPVPKGTFTLRIKTTKSAASQRLRDVLSWDPRSRSKKEAASTFRAASIMQRLCQACLMNGNLDLAGYCAFTLVELCETSEQGQGNLLVIGYSLCGYMSLIMGNLDFAESYSTKATTIISNFPHLPEVDKAIAQNQLGMYRAYGNWNEALNLFRSAKKIFKNYGERKKWRESTLMIGIVLHMQGEFEECKRHFDKLLNFAQEDGDLYLQSNALLWKALTDLQVEGASRTLDTALAIQNEIQADSIVVRVTIGYNLGEILGWPENKITFDAMTALRSSSLDTVIQFATERMIKELTKSTNLLWYNIYKYVNSLNALFDACERCTVEEKSKRDQFINAAEQVLKSFAKSFPFPYAKSYKKFLQARYEFLNNQERTGRRHMLKAAREALSTKMPFVQAASLYHIACHQEGAKRDQNLELARMIFVQHKVKINQHSHFKALWQDRDNAIDQDDKVDEMIPENFDLDKIIESELEQESASRQSLGIRASTLARRSTTKKPVPLFTSSRSRESESLPSKTFTM